MAFAIAACVTLAAASSRAGDVTSLYQWTDEDGVIRYTPDRAHIPLPQRGSAVRIEPTPSFSDSTADAQVTPAHEAPSPPAPAPDSTIGRRETVSATPQPALQPAPRPAVTARPDPAPARPEDAAYAIQLGALPVSQGVPPLPPIGLPNTVRLYQTRTQRNGESWTRTRVGPFPTMASARQMLERLEPSFPGAWIVSVSAAETRIAAATSASPPPAPEAPPNPAPRYVYVIQLHARPQSAVPPPLPRLDLPEGFQLYRKTFEKDGRVWDRVRVGFFPTLADAQAMRARLEPRFPGAWIDRVPGAEHIASSRMAAPPLP
jgi:cell division septation protein DedD